MGRRDSLPLIIGGKFPYIWLDVQELERQLAASNETSGDLATEQENLQSQLSEIHHIIETLNKALMDLDHNKLLIISRLKSDDVKQEIGQELDNLKYERYLVV